MFGLPQEPRHGTAKRPKGAAAPAGGSMGAYHPLHLRPLLLEQTLRACAVQLIYPARVDPKPPAEGWGAKDIGTTGKFRPPHT